ncbi:serine--tRNA ligase [Candidatus Odyssella acanthamoebae]|uniref:Serine--tRNA ligase n=1 Tax=Candidatus Odyssella acanthamoebae TaxID=91604 RepID=A0A077AYH9_9PROT|nr:serine--tRNA ligase [Candidatus Paracaedibacter acanthamoebae]AIK95780.1 serine--tRNA ligase [Candidatus Paracaedibacter acanthamoebae]
MLDLKLIRTNPEILDASLKRRGKNPIAQQIVSMDESYRAALTELQELQTKRNQLAKSFGEAKRTGQDTTALAAEADQIKAAIAALESKSNDLNQVLLDELSGIPNLVADDTPEGLDETTNIELRRVGNTPSFDFEPKPHFDLGEALGKMDFEVAAKLAGSRFVVLYSELARLERALAAFMIDIHTQKYGYQEVYTPILVNEKTMYGTGQLPKFRDDQFQTTSGYWMIPTAEVALTNLVAETIQSEDQLPLRFTSYTPCFREEAGSAGRDTRGMIRQHQFGKVELVSITHPSESKTEHDRMTSAAEDVLQGLKLPYRVMALCAGDMGFAAQKTYDLEVWLPSQNIYREISSCSNCGDFQARRMNARFRPQASADNPKPGTEFVHTLNGSGLAIGRTIVAILENYQRHDGSIAIPTALIPYMGGVEVIAKK